MREIREIGPADIEEYLQIYLHAYPAFKTLDSECFARYREKNLLDMTADKNVEFFGLFEDGELSATMKLIVFEMNVYGKMLPAVGLMALAVHPLKKKRGMALDMVKFFEEYTLRKGASIAILLPFSMSFYRKMGYGLGSKLDEYRLPTSSLPRQKDLSSLRLLSLEDLPEVLECHGRYAERTHGMLKKFGEEIRDMEKDTQVRRVGCYTDGRLAGYAAYRFKDASEVNYTKNEMVVEELIYESGKELKALLGYLRNQEDEAQITTLRTGESEFYHLLDDPQDTSENYIPFGYLQTNVSAIGNMYKIVDLERFVEQCAERSFPAEELTLEIDYFDELANSDGVLKIEFKKLSDGTASRWFLAKPDAKADVALRCRKSDLSSLLLNSARLGALVLLGAAEISEADKTELLDRLFYYEQKPYSNTDF